LNELYKDLSFYVNLKSKMGVKVNKVYKVRRHGKYFEN